MYNPHRASRHPILSIIGIYNRRFVVPCSFLCILDVWLNKVQKGYYLAGKIELNNLKTYWENQYQSPQIRAS